jgi:uncharacterized membrane protein YfcA
MEIIKLVSTFFVGLFASFIGSMVGSGGLISIPFLIFLGFPPHIAIATNRVGAVGLQLGALSRFMKSKEIVWKYVVWFSVLALVAAQVGSRLLLQTDEALLKKIIVAIMLSVLPTIFLKTDIGLENKNVSGIRKAIGYVLVFLMLVWQAFFGGGAATMIFYVMMFSFGMTINRASATNKIPGLFLGLSSLFMFIAHDIVNWTYGIDMFFGMLVGGYLGAHTALRKGNAWVKALFAVIVVLSVVKLLLG